MSIKFNFKNVLPECYTQSVIQSITMHEYTALNITNMFRQSCSLCGYVIYTLIPPPFFLDPAFE